MSCKPSNKLWKRERHRWKMAASDDVTLNTLGFEVEAGDVVKLVLQFLHEQGLSNSAGQSVT